MSRIQIDGPEGPEEVHLLQAAEKTEDRARLARCEKRRLELADKREMRGIALIALIVSVIVVVGLIKEGTLVAGLVTFGLIGLVAYLIKLERAPAKALYDYEQLKTEEAEAIKTVKIAHAENWHPKALAVAENHLDDIRDKIRLLKSGKH